MDGRRVDDRIGFLPNTLELCDHLLLEVVAAADGLHVPLAHAAQTVLRRIAVDDGYPQFFHVMIIARQKNGKCRFPYAALLVAQRNQ